MLIALFYEVVLCLAACLALPKALYQAVFYKKYRHSIKRRLGFGGPKIDKGPQKLIWLHAVSVGEIKACAKLALKLKEDLGARLLVSSVTETGHAEAKRAVPAADWHIYLPLDFYALVAPFVKRVRPDIVVIAETDLWYNFMRLAKRLNAKIYVVNGKISEKSKNRFKKVPFLTGRLFSLIDLFCVQSCVYQKRFLELGVSLDKIHVTGNLKFNSAPQFMTHEEAAHFKASLSLKEGDITVVVGSTHDPEEEAMLEVFKALWQKIPHLKVVFVPRHPERFEMVAQLIKSQGLNLNRYTCKEHADAPVILVDAMGLLNRCYQIANVAIVAGSYTDKVGGHNILEPLWFGVPTIFGPEMQGQPELADIVIRYKSGLQVPLAELAQVLKAVIEDVKLKESLKRGATQLIAEMQGSTELTGTLLLADSLKK